jgi:hypothetical protein
MYMPIQEAALALSLLHSSLPTAGTDLHPAPIMVSGVVCGSPRDMAGLYQINSKQPVKSADELLALGRGAGLTCQLLTNTNVISWGPAGGPDGTIQIAGGKPVTIVEVVPCTGSDTNHYFLIAKGR